MIAGLLFMGGLRRSEVAALRWADVTDARDGDGVLLTVRTSKTNQEGDAADVRYLKNGPAKAIRTVRADRPDAAPTDRVVGLSPVQIQRRFTAAARAAGIEARVTAHSGRVGLASELTARGASTTEVMAIGIFKRTVLRRQCSFGTHGSALALGRTQAARMPRRARPLTLGTLSRPPTKSATWGRSAVSWSRDRVRRVPLPRAALRLAQVRWRHSSGDGVAQRHGHLALLAS